MLLPGVARADVPNEPPSVQISSPMEGAMFDGPTALVDVTLDAYTGDDGISSVILRVDGEDVATDDSSPYGFEGVELGVGMHSLVAVAVSKTNPDEYPSAAVEVVVFAEDGGSADEASGDSGESPKSCTVDSEARLGGGGGLIGLGLLLLGLARRRRRELVA